MSGSRSLRQALVAASAVTQMAIVTIVALWLGNQLDGWLGSSPLGLLVLTTLGFFGGLYRLQRSLSPTQEHDDPQDPPP